MGKVYLVGAGPGDAGLYTVKAKEVIKKADVVVYDYLANEVFFEWIKKECKIIYAGKKGGDHTLSQQEINKLLVELAGKYDVVVRLKGGDPYVFGRGGEEALFLVENNIEFEVVPGVSSGIAAPAYAGIPLTHRDISSSITFITGHEAEEKKESVLDWKSLARSASTLVFFMGVKNLPIITKNLINAGMDKNMPAALIRWGTTCRQRTLISTIENISKEAREANFKPPALLVVGEVVKLKEKLSWFEKRPLIGKNIIITRSRAQASELAKRVENLGGCAIIFPTIEIRELSDYSELFKELERLNTYDWIIFTSVNGVDLFFKKLFEKGMDVRAISSLKICAIGPATKKRLEKYFLHPDMVPEKYVAEGIIKHFKKQDIKGKKILIPRAYEARQTLIEGLEELGAEVKVVPVYKTVIGGGNRDKIEKMIKDNKIHYITFTSSSTVKNFFSLISPEIIRKYGKGVKFACIGPITGKTLEDFGFNVDIMPSRYTISALVEEILRNL